MKKEEFPTFLNEQPTIIFGRTGRELLIVAIGLGFAYLSWLRLGTPIAGSVFLSDILKAIIAAVFVIAALIVAFIKFATQPIEQWAFIWLFYIIIPKVYLYKPEDIDIQPEKQDEETEEAKPKIDDDYEDD
jgi:hypothetical protein